MEFRCEKYDLSRAVSAASRAASNRSPLPVLEGVLIDAHDDIVLTGYDTITTIRSKISGEVVEPGSIVVNAKMIASIVRKLSDSEVTIKTKANNTVCIKNGSSVFNIKGLDADSFPQRSETISENVISIGQKSLKGLLEQTLFATSTDEARPILNGILIESSANEVKAVALDGFRLAASVAKLDNQPDIKIEEWPAVKFVISGKMASYLLSVLGNDGQAKLYQTQNHNVVCETETETIISSSIDGEFLNYNAVIPSDCDNTFSLNSSELRDSLERAVLISSGDGRMIPATLLYGTGDNDSHTLSIDIRSATGTFHDDIEINNAIGSLDSDYNPKFFLDVLKVIPNENILIKVNERGFCCITSENESDFLYLVLPTRRG